ncbi:MAG: flavin-containing monooxygenase [Propionibacteriaceae bacterium]
MSRRALVLGAGPAGLAVGAALRRHGWDGAVELVDSSERIGASWSQRYDGLRLHTVRWLSGLPGAPIPRRYGRWVTRDDFAAYLGSYADQFGLRPALGVTATRVDRAGAGWRVGTDCGVREADAVVVATGYTRVPVVPDWPGRAGSTVPLRHSSAYRSPVAYGGRSVLVVGSGNSATEIASELAGSGSPVQLAVRTPPNVVRRSTLGVPSQLIGLSMTWAPEPVLNLATGLLRRVSVPDLTAYGLPAPKDAFTQFLRTRTVPVLDHGFVDLVRSGAIEVVAAVSALDGDAVVLADGRRLRPDAVVAATGFRPALGDLLGHLGLLDDEGLPRIKGAQSAPGLPDLHVVGITVELSGLLREIGREADAVGRTLSASLTAR